MLGEERGRGESRNERGRAEGETVSLKEEKSHPKPCCDQELVSDLKPVRAVGTA